MGLSKEDIVTADALAYDLNQEYYHYVRNSKLVVLDWGNISIDCGSPEVRAHLVTMARRYTEMKEELEELRKASMKAKKTTKMYRCFQEDNDWEGETWNFYIPVEGNEDELEKLAKLVEGSGEYQLHEELIPESEVRTLVKHGEVGYMAEHNMLKGKLVLPEKPEFYKGQIADYIK